MQDVGRKMAKGAVWMLTARVIDRVISLASTLCLARLLMPEDFGVIALAVSVLSLLEVMGAFNFDLALIQNQQAERRHYDTAWTLNLIYALLTGLLMVALAVPMSHFYGDPRVEGLMYAFGARSLIGGFKNIGVVGFQKELNFGAEFLYAISGKVISVVVTVALAYYLRSYWALAIGTLVGTSIAIALTYVMHPFRPRFSLAGWRELWRFSSWMLFSNICMFAGNRGYDFMIGRVAGAQSLGLYTVAYEISNLPTTEIVWPVSKAIFPGFSKVAHDRPQLRTMFLQAAALVAMIAIPAGAGVAVLADPIVRLLLSEKWLAAVPLIQILAMFGVLRAMHAGTGAVYMALGMTRIMAWVAIPHIVIGLPLATFLLVQYDLRAAMLGVLAAGAAALALSFGIMVRTLLLKGAELGGVFWRPVLATVVMVLMEREALDVLGPVAGTPRLLAWTLLLVVAGAVVYSLIMLLLWMIAGRPAGAERIVLDRLHTWRAERGIAN